MKAVQQLDLVWSACVKGQTWSDFGQDPTNGDEDERGRERMRVRASVNGDGERSMITGEGKQSWPSRSWRAQMNLSWDHVVRQIDERKLFHP